MTESVVESSKDNESDEKLIQIKNLKTYFYTEEGIVKAVDGVSFDIYNNEVLGLVGETGCGKSVTALSILNLVRAPGKIIDGQILFKDTNLVKLNKKEMKDYRGNDITMIFQDPLNSLNPVMTVGTQVGETFLLHQKSILKSELDRRLLERKKKREELKGLKQKFKRNEKLEKSPELERDADTLSEEEIEELQLRIDELSKETDRTPTLKDVREDFSADIIKEVGIADSKSILHRYPHELSGGMRQRVMIAMALSCNPALLIADEPTTALDVTIQAQILDLMKILKKRFKTSILLITHDLGVIAELCHRVAVMYSGNIVEYATAEELFKKPRHPYTQGLLSAIPSIKKRDGKLTTIRGMVPNLIYPPSGCRFHPRCDYRLEVCDKVKPKLCEIGEKYFIACHLFDPEYKDSPKFDWKGEESGNILSSLNNK
ncbi:MAG: ATP-binding cassette domain-containing protein [Candidatus Lokiarchaeota archaeon]|nr:ATP-binding cassette domain-containing protein [Candidatus Lokiarchaeota archaeon]